LGATLAIAACWWDDWIFGEAMLLRCVSVRNPTANTTLQIALGTVRRNIINCTILSGPSKFAVACGLFCFEILFEMPFEMRAVSAMEGDEVVMSDALAGALIRQR
jgi:hypothetical protein